MFEIVGFQQKKIFSLDDAQSILEKFVYRITDESAQQVKYFVGCIEALPDKKCDKALELQEKINFIIGRWQNKLERMGIKPKGLWLADFDNGAGYYCWKFPETQISYFHGYQDGFSGRRLVEPKTENEMLNENSPSSN